MNRQMSTSPIRYASMGHKIEVAANVVFIVIALLLAFVFMRNYLTTNSPVPEVKEGDLLPALPNYEWRSHNNTLLLALRKDCHFCEDSAPFYQKLRELEKQGQLDVHLIAVLPDSSAAAAEMLQSKQLEIDIRAGVTLRDLKIFATPTLLFVGANGRVRHVWQGQLSPSEENHVIELVRARTQSKLLDDSTRVLPVPVHDN